MEISSVRTREEGLSGHYDEHTVGSVGTRRGDTMLRMGKCRVGEGGYDPGNGTNFVESYAIGDSVFSTP
ncbi:hypothetical protein V6N12_074437 [Hibiscus sabdariffa]|uniref:Uncharacterized protein n=1 Tax=Hibiscus sabdariffa TaxID=183260 RepID=A0ABR2BL27_9ROSI